MNTLQAFTAGVALGSTGAFTVSLLIWQIPKIVRRLLNWRASHWTDNDFVEIQAFEQYVGGFTASTGEQPLVTSAVQWERPDEEEGSLIPRWRPIPATARQPYAGPPVTRLRDWITWNYGDYLANWSTFVHDYQQDGRGHRLV